MKGLKLGKNRKLAQSVRGAAIITALTFVIIISILLAGVARVSASHLTRGVTEADYAAAIQLADAGINYELRWISDDTGDPTRPHQKNPSTGQNSAYTGTLSTMPNGSFTVYVTNDPDDGTSWRAPNAAIVTSIGTYRGISRAVTVRSVRKSLFDEFALWADDTATLNGTNTTINGNFGTNGSISLGTGEINGDITLNGGTASLAGSTDEDVYSSSVPIDFPTVDQIANALFPSGGMTWLKTNNNNANLKQFSKDRVADPNFLLANIISAGFTSTDYSVNAQAYNKGGGLTTDTSTADRPIASGGTRFCTQNEGLYNQSVLIFPPGDYYFESIDVSGARAWLIDNGNLTGNGTPAPVRIWVGGTGTNGDTLGGTFIFTSTDPSKFRLFYNKCATLSVPGNSTFNGSFYAIRDGCSAPKVSALSFTGGSTINGSVIGQNLTVSGGTVVNFPNNGGGADPTDYSLWFGFKDSWKEVSIASGLPVFADGTSK
jgi:Tfp pilus assembly protein PilX